MTLRDLACSKLLRDNSVEITDEKFNGYLDYLVTTLSSQDGTSYTRQDLLDSYGESKLMVDAKAYFSAQIIYDQLECLPFDISYMMLY